MRWIVLNFKTLFDEFISLCMIINAERKLSGRTRKAAHFRWHFHSVASSEQSFQYIYDSFPI